MENNHHKKQHARIVFATRRSGELVFFLSPDFRVILELCNVHSHISEIKA